MKKLSKIFRKPPKQQTHEEQYGLFPLMDVVSDSTTNNNYEVDIVAIHGLNGGARKTWTHKNGTFWLQELLPQSMPGARIFSYGYPSEVFNQSVAEIRDYAKHLLSSLMNARQSDEQPRPIIYVCHSLGGIVFKQAMVIAHNSSRRFPEIELWSKGVIFLGTPHRGSSSANWGKLLGDIGNAAFYASGSSALVGKFKTPLLQNLSQNSAELRTIADSFTERGSTFYIVTFYETVATPPFNNPIVGEDSAVIGFAHEESLPLYLNHRQLCQFKDKDDKNYEQVSSALKRTARAILNNMNRPASSQNSDRSFNEAEKACIALLNTTDLAEFEAGLSPQADGTLQWILNDQQYTSWVSSTEARLLWVTGYPGCGKTILASYIVRHLAERSQPGVITCRFFCDNKREKHRDVCALLRSLIYQITACRRGMLKLVRRACDSQGFQLFNRFEALWNLFLQIVRDKRIGSINIIIDAIDECDQNTQFTIIERIVELLNVCASTSVKVCITSRPVRTVTAAIQGSQSQILQLQLEDMHDVIGHDVNLVIRQRMKELVRKGICKPSTSAHVEQVLVSKADRTFLWVHLVLPLFEGRRLLPDSDVERLAAELPPDLASVYEKLLYSIPLGDRILAGKMLRVLVSSARPLNGTELGILLFITPETRSTSSFVKEEMYDLEAAQTLLGPLIRVSESRISLIHQSLKEYLIDLSHDQGNPLASVFGVDVQRDTLLLASACMQYLGLDEFDESIFLLHESSDELSVSSKELESNDETSVISLNLGSEHIFKEDFVIESETCIATAIRYGLFDYAALHWASHFAQSNTMASLEQHKAAIALSSFGSNRLTNWLRYFWSMSDMCEPYPSVFGPVIVASFFGQTKTLQILLEDEQSQETETLEHALYWAAREGHEICTQVLCEQKDIDSNVCLVNNRSPLAIAAQHGHLKSVQKLIEFDGTDVNVRGYHGRTPLSLAAASGNTDIVSILLAHKRIIPDLADRDNETPLFWALGANSLSAISQLLADDRVSPNHLDKRGRNILSWAAEDGLVDQVILLLKHKRVDVANKDLKGRTPLSYAAQHGHLDIVKLLTRSKRASVSERDINGRNILSWAACQKNAAVLSYLLKHDSTGADVSDDDGWTPLAWALDPPGYPDNFFTLVHSGLVDVNRKDRVHGRAPLSWAASYGHLYIVDILINAEGIDLDTRDNSGRTPLSHAAGNGNLGVVSRLIATKKVDKDFQDYNGRTPSKWASLEHHDAVVKELSSQSVVEIVNKA